MEVAGVVLGAVPLILYALDNYQRAWDPVKDIWHWKETIETIRTQIFLQKQQLQTTLRVLDLELTDHTTMEEIEAALQIIHSSRWEQFIGIIRQMDNLVNGIAKDLYPDAQGPPNWADAKSDRMSWEWRRVRRSFGRKERKEIFNQLQKWNTALQNCGLERREILPDSENRITNLIRRRFDESRTATIRENVRVLHKAISSSLDCNCSDPHQGNIQLNWHDRKPFTSSAFSLAISSTTIAQGSNANTSISWKPMAVNIEQSVRDQVISIPSTGTSSPPPNPGAASCEPLPSKKSGVRFLGIQISRDTHKRPKSPSGRLSPAAATQIITVPTSAAPQPSPPTPSVRLCSMLRTSHGHDILTCIAVAGSDPLKQAHITSADRCASARPAVQRRTVRLHALLSRVADQVTNRRLALARKQRFAIAAALAWAVLHLCDSPWLKDALNDEDIHLFLEQENGAPVPRLSTHPYISCSFAVPPAGSGSPVSNMSSSAQFQNLQAKNMTLYSLAICLIELGLNRPFSRIRQEYHASIVPSPTTPVQPNTGPNPNTAALIDDFDVAKHQITELILDVGTSYGHAVDRCLRFLFPGPAAMNTFEHRSFRSTFFADVVAPIQTTFELIPGTYSEVLL